MFESLRLTIDKRTRQLLPNLIGLTDAFGYTDWELNSTLGSAAGRPYEELLNFAEETKEWNLSDRKYRGDVLALLQDGRSAARSSKL